MTPAERPALFALIADVLGFYGQATSPFALSVWWEACKSLDLQAVRGAMTAHATDPDRGHFSPKPADILRIIRGSSAERANSAWVHVLGQVRSVGSYGSPKLDEQQRAALDALGGFGAVCRSDESELPFLHRRFVEQFSLGEQREQREALTTSSPLKLA